MRSHLKEHPSFGGACLYCCDFLKLFFHVACLGWILMRILGVHYAELNSTCQETYQILELAGLIIILMLVSEVMIALVLAEALSDVCECLLGCEVACLCVEGCVTLFGRMVVGVYGLYKVVLIATSASFHQEVDTCRPLFHCAAAVFGINALMGLGVLLMCIAGLECISARERAVDDGLDIEYRPALEE
mmetsp:Transcript_143735/g.400641  ORF Transcript_143735/g.400641 Transcript_143735/m.400641 type:complete len:189 (+) Transcript_143735:58-624(+)